MPRTPLPAALVAGLLAVGLGAVAGCGAERSLDPAPRRSPPTATSGPPRAADPRSPAPAPSQPVRLTAAPSMTFPEAYAVTCAGRPGAEQVLALLRRTAGLLPSGVTVTVLMAPQCAGTWQYTVVSVPDREPLQVVTRGVPTALQLVTAGTNVCTIEVRTQAPRGILTLARC